MSTTEPPARLDNARITAAPAAAVFFAPARHGSRRHARALAAALCLGSLGPVAAQTAPGVQATERIVVTGSNIRRTDSETPSPLQTLTAADIQRSGYSSLADVLQALSANNMGSLSNASPAAFGAGGSGISLRGLTVGATLVLIDGHRMASYPLPDDGQRDFVDISSIPIEAVERVEVLKDGASAIYGSDAIAGVVNVILKKQHKGTQLQAEMGQSSRRDGQMLKLSGIQGFADFEKHGHGGYIAVGYKQTRPILLNQRPGLADSDWTRYGGEDLGLTANPELQVAPRTRNVSLLAKMNQALPGAWTLTLTGSVLGSKATQVGLPNSVSPSGGITTFRFGPANPLPQPTALNGTNIIDPATGSPVDYAFDEFGAQRSQTDSRSLRLVAELAGSWAGWDVQAAAGHTRVATDLTLSNYLSLPALQAALNSGKYVLGSMPSAAVREALTPQAASTATNRLDFVSLRGSRELAQLPGGALSLGTGLEYLRRQLNQQFPSTFASGQQGSNIYAFGVGAQTVTAAHAELVAPLTRQLEVDVAARVDHYNTYGRSATPKAGIKFQPSQQLILRGTYARGFRAPNAVESGISGSSAGFLPPLVDTALCKFTGTAPCDIGVGGTQLQLPGQSLKPEKSRSHTLGFVFEPNRHFNLSVDYYDIRISDQIVSVGLFGQGQIDNPLAYGTQLYRVNSPTTPNAAPTSADDTILFGTYPFINLGQTRTDGIDVDLRLRFDLGAWGRFSPQLQWSRMLHYTIEREGRRYEMVGTHGPSFVSTNTGTPRDRASLALNWTRGAWDVTATVQHIGGFKVEDSSYDVPDCSAALATIFPSGAPANSPLCRVRSFTTVNLAANWQVLPGVALRATVANLFDRGPPMDAFASSSTGGGVTSGGAHYNPALHQAGAVGRFITLGATWRF